MEASSRKNVSQAVHWPMLWTTTKDTLWHPSKASGPSLGMSDDEIRCIGLRGNEDFIHVSHLNTLKHDAQP